MGPPKRFGAGGGGGKKGPRHHLGSFKNKTVKLRPAPEKPRNQTDDNNDDATSFPGERGNDSDSDSDGGEHGMDGVDQDEFSYREGLRGEMKPLEGKSITVTGCGSDKAELLQIAESLGAKVEAGLTNTTTHVVADMAGSAKYETAVKLHLRIMHPQWIRDVHSAWRSAEEADYDDLERQWRMAPFFNTNVCITQFTKGDYRTKVVKILRDNGALVSSALGRETQYLIVASSASPHNREPDSEKLEAALGAQQKGHSVRIVWEGWMKEVVRDGGIRLERDEFWTWRGEGTLEPREERDWIRPRGAIAESETMVEGLGEVDAEGLMDVYGRGEEESVRKSVTVGVNVARDEKEVMVPKKRRALGLGRKGGHLAVDSLLDAYNPSQSNMTTTNALASASTSLLPQSRRQQSRPQVVEMAMELSEDKVLRMGVKGKSVIKALSTFRSTSFLPSDPHAPKKILSVATNHSNPFRTTTADAADDSAFFEESLAPREWEEGQEGEAPTLPCFEGIKFVLVGTPGMETALTKIRDAILARKGLVLEDERVDEADWICVHFASPPIEYLNSDDPRVATFAWIESCCYWESFREPGEDLLERPIPYTVPVPGGDKLHVALACFDELCTAQVARFVQALGGTSTESLDATCTHLAHNSFDTPGALVDGKKAELARLLGIPIIGVKWLKNFGAEKAVERDREERERKGKGKASEWEVAKKLPTRDITNTSRNPSASLPRAKSSATDETSVGILNDCTVLVSSKCAFDVKPLNALVLAHGGSVASSLTSTVTHFVYASSKVNETFAQFKNAKKNGVCIVHPLWLEESSKRGELLNEGDFPHTLDPKKGAQLFGIVASPPRARSMSRVNSATSHVLDAREGSAAPPSTSHRTSPAKSVAPSLHDYVSNGEVIGGDVIAEDAGQEGELQYYDGHEPATGEGQHEYDEHDLFIPAEDNGNDEPLDRLSAAPVSQLPSQYFEDASELHIPIVECGHGFNSTVDKSHTTATTPSHHTANAEVELAVIPASSPSPGQIRGIPESSPPTVQLERQNSNLNPNLEMDVSSDDPPPPAPETRNEPPPMTPNTLLKHQTALLKAQFDAIPVETVEARRRRARSMARKRSANSDTTSASTSAVDPFDLLAAPQAPTGPRHFPGMGPVDSSQPHSSQFFPEEYSIDVRYQDPAALRAQAKIREALGIDPVTGKIRDTVKDPERGKRTLDEVEVEQESVAKGKTPRKTAKARK